MTLQEEAQLRHWREGKINEPNPTAPYPKDETLTHEQRRRLIESPITINTYGRRYVAGTCVVDESGLNREFTPTPRGTGMWRIKGVSNG